MKVMPVLLLYSKNGDPAAEVGMALFTTALALGLYGGVLCSGELRAQSSRDSLYMKRCLLLVAGVTS
jgi:hypothetical protein